MIFTITIYTYIDQRLIDFKKIDPPRKQDTIQQQNMFVGQKEIRHEQRTESQRSPKSARIWTLRNRYGY